MSDSPRCSLSVKEGDGEEAELTTKVSSCSAADQRASKGALQLATAPTTVTDNPLDQASAILGRDVDACDLLCSLFAAALTNYRRDTVLRPFPQQYVNDVQTASPGQCEDRKRFESLKCVMDEIPPLPFIVQQNQIDNRSGIMSKECGELLAWILDTKGFIVKSSNTLSFAKIKELTGQIGEAVQPSHIFEVIYAADAEAKFQLERNGRDFIYAYHGSRIENFHSILHNGLCNHMNKNSLFGQGTYLSSELSVCMPYSPTGQGWNRSVLGTKMSCVAVCQITRHADVRCHIRDSKNQAGVYKALDDNISGEDVPEKYYIVQNDEHVRVKYLLLFVEAAGSKVTRRLTVSRPVQRFDWIRNHKSILVMMIYVVLLMSIGFSNSRSFKMFVKKYIWWPQ